MLANIRPSGKFLMEDFYYAGGLRGLCRAAVRPARTARVTVERPHAGREPRRCESLQRRRDPPARQSAGRRTTGWRCCTAISRPTARSSSRRPWSRSLRNHTGPAVVFRDYNDMAARIDDPGLVVTADSVIVLQSAGPQGAPGMPEWGQLPIPKKLLQGRRARHGAHLRCADERHQLRRLRAACRARIAHRRTARARARWRPDRARRARRASSRSRSTTPNSRAAAPHGRRRSRTTRAASARCI